MFSILMTSLTDKPLTTTRLKTPQICIFNEKKQALHVRFSFWCIVVECSHRPQNLKLIISCRFLGEEDKEMCKILCSLLR